MNQERTTHDIDNDELTIDLGELFSVLWNKIYIIILAGIVLAFAAFACTQLLITPNHLSKLFRQEVGMSAQDYLQSRRLELARRLLVSSQLTVAEVAHDAGFESPNYFARFFRRRLGLSPSEFRLHKTVEKQES